MTKHDKSVLVVIKEDGYTDICVGETYGEGNWMISGEFWYEKSDSAITHWMPLPELCRSRMEHQHLMGYLRGYLMGCLQGLQVLQMD